MNRRQFLLVLALSQLAVTNKNVYLTIDDGPVRTSQILEKLRKQDRLTFFMIGSYLTSSKRYSAACKVLEQGHVIGNHSYTHQIFSTISIDEAKKEIEKADNLLEKLYKNVGVRRPLLFRFPYNENGGNLERRTKIKEFLDSMDYKICLWDLDTKDWEFYTKEKTLDNILDGIKKTHNGDVVIIHELPMSINKIIPFYINNGYNLKSII